jgi:2-methylcitrate dehydratase PrpD
LKGEIMSADSMNQLIALAKLPGAAIPASARQMARFSLFDWMVVARAGQEEPLARIIRDYASEEGGVGHASLIGGGLVPSRSAALVNGTISHALDYDDTHFAHVGHPSVGIMPAALAAGEEVGAPAAAVADAFLVGAEGSIRLGMLLGRGHYQRGFHQTATAGAFGATMAAGRLYGLDDAQLRNALSLVATRASGLKSQFGTMGKAFNAGISASNGVEAAALARRGFVSCDDGIGGPQGFIDTHADAPDHDQPWRRPPPGTFLFEDIKYKLHACCHGTHAMIEVLATARVRNAIAPQDVKVIRLRVNPRWLRVCDIKTPRTGLEVKFSYAWLAGMVFHGIDTASDAAYTDALCGDPRLVEFAARVHVVGDESLSDTATEALIERGTGPAIAASHDLAVRIPAPAIEQGLRAKARGLIGAETAERLWPAVADLDRGSARELGALLRARG